MGAEQSAALIRWRGRGWSRSIAAAAALIVLAPGAACTATPSCYSGGAPVRLPDEKLVMKALTNAGAGRDIAAAVFAGDTALVELLAKGDHALLTTHVPPPIYPDFRPDGQYGDLLTFAVARCDATMLDTLLRLGASADGAVPGAALDLAIRASDLGLARRLLAAGASPDPQKQGGKIYPMQTAGRIARPDAAQLLIDAGADLAWTDDTGTTVLQTIVDMDSMRVAEVLVAARADAWAVGAGGALPARGIAEPLRLASPQEEVAQRRLVARVRKPGLPWPPPDPATVRRMVLAGEWPPSGGQALGLKPAPPKVVALLKRTVH